MIDIKDTAVGAARKAGALLKENLGRVVRVEYKGAVDLVTEMDKSPFTLPVDNRPPGRHDQLRTRLSGFLGFHRF
jgi:hypothetical protein